MIPYTYRYKLEMGQVIEPHIYRNVWVINLIFVFAFLGLIKVCKMQRLGFWKNCFREYIVFDLQMEQRSVFSIDRS